MSTLSIKGLNSNTMSLPTSLITIYFILTCWDNAGFGDGSIALIRLLLSLLLVFILLNKYFYKKNIKLFLLISLFPLYFIISLFNRNYHLEINGLLRASDDLIKNIDFSNENHLFAKERLIKAVNLSEYDKSTSLSILFDLKNQLDDRREFSLAKKIEDITKSLRYNYSKYLPSIFIYESSIILKFVFVFFHLLSGWLLFKFVSTKRELNIFIIILFLNASVLSIVGIIQKLDIFDQYNENFILGIWEAPEARYFFSTFTYKNHWSCFAIVSIFYGLYIVRKILKYDFLFFRNSLPLFLILIMPILISIPLSGSRSGIAVLLVSIAASIILINKVKKFKLIYLILILASFVFFLLFKNHNIINEIIKTTSSQFTSYKGGNMPLRLVLWSDSLQQIRKNIWFGSGFDSYSVNNPLYQSKEVRDRRNQLLSNAHNSYIPLTAHAHSDWLEWFCEWGNLGVFISYAPFLILSTVVLIGNKSQQCKLFAIGVISMLIYSIVDFPLRTPCNTMYMSLTVATSLKLYFSKTKFSHRT